MGQINSTRNPDRQTIDQEAAAGQTSTSDAPDGTIVRQPDTRPNDTRRDRRRSLRNSIVGFVNSKPSRDTEGDPSREGRRWWRRRSRLSKVQLTRQAEHQDVVSGEASHSSDAPSQMHAMTSGQQANVSRTAEGTQSSDNRRGAYDPTTEPEGSASTEVPDNDRIPSSKGKERQVESSSDTAKNPHTDSTSTSQASDSAGQSSSRGAATTLNSDSPSQSPPEGTSSAPTTSSSPESSAAQAPSNNNFLRQFPPSGTLVVVQGIVHTDPPSRSTRGNSVSLSNAGGSPSATTSNTQQDISVSPYARQTVSSTPSESVSTGASSSQDVSSSTSLESVMNAGRNDSSGIPSSPEPLNAGAGSNPQTRGNSTDSHGPDILGALLSIVSVATAATAASLLSAPNALRPPSSLSDRAPTPAVAPATPPALNGSNLPLIARALASANPAAAAIIAQREREREERERTRVRSIWEGLRDRVTSSRANRSSPPSTASRSHSSAISSGGDGIDDTFLNLDSLLNELARAFNLASTPDERASDVPRPPTPHPDAEAIQDSSSDLHTTDENETDERSNGGFEQFLVDLQSDLRLALTRPDPEPDVASARQSEQHDEREGAGTLRENARNDEVERNGTMTESPPAALMHEPTENEPSVVEGALTLPSPSIVEGPAVSDMSSLDVGPPCTEDVEPNASSGNPSPSGQGALEGAAPTTDNATPRRNGINWWRMYRFPAVHPTQPRQDTTGNNVSQAEATSAPNVPSTFNPTSGSERATPPSGPPAEGADTVIPVIIVGLQSIGSAPRRTPPPMRSRLTQENGMGGENNFRTEEFDSQSSAESQRLRNNWPSRAARAFGRLGRRGSTRENETPGNNGGARAFLIYVFGGHYPPDHHILAGPGEMDSFEALWELAEFLGQAKPPVVTEEEIERSGLELFKAESLKEFEASGRVASNCVDRCLVCLEDYGSDDDLRLLTCKHAFHKACVDRWLKTGRNNCPACRREGVKMGSNQAAGSQ